MKKRLLITSIVMMLVVAVALSTATYAWFTSNTRVEASTISLTASTSAGAAFGISWDGNNNYSTALENVAAPATSFNPLVPATYATSGNSQTETDVRFATATMRQEGGAEKYNADVKWWDIDEEESSTPHADGYNTAAKPYIWNNGSEESFYIKNLSTSNGQDHLYVFADVTGAASDMVRIAIFDEGSLIGILGYTYTYTKVTDQAYSGTTQYYKPVTHGYLPETVTDADDFAAKKETTAGLYIRSEDPEEADVYYGTVTANVNVLTTHDDSDLSIDLGHFDASEAREITVYVWLDGKFLDDDTQTTTANINLHFDTTDPYATTNP